MRGEKEIFKGWSREGNRTQVILWWKGEYHDGKIQEGSMGER